MSQHRADTDVDMDGDPFLENAETGLNLQDFQIGGATVRLTPTFGAAMAAAAAAQQPAPTAEPVSIL